MTGRKLQVEVYEPDEMLPADLLALRRFARLMDAAFAIPGTRKRLGLSSAIGLIPGVGDAVGALLGSWLIFGALRHRVPMPKIARMLVNLLIDLGIGAIPVIGDVFDFFFTENLSNAEILIRHRDRTRPPRSSVTIAIVFAAALFLILVTAGGAIVLLLVALYYLFERFP